MTGKERIARTGLLAVLAAAAVARADMGADTEASVLASALFQAGLFPAALIGWFGADQLGQAGAQGWARSLALFGAALAAVAALGAGLGLASPALWAGVPQSSVAWITAGAGVIICHVQAMRQNHRAARH